MHTWINDIVKMKIKIETIPTRITNYFQKEVCSRRKTDTYYYHQRKWNKKVTSNSKTETKQIFTILTDEHAALVHSVRVFQFNSPHHCDGSVFRCFVDSLYFYGITGNNHLSSATNHRKFKWLMRGMKHSFCFSWHFWVISREVGEKTLHEKGLLRSIYWRNLKPLFS